MTSSKLTLGGVRGLGKAATAVTDQRMIVKPNSATVGETVDLY